MRRLQDERGGTAAVVGVMLVPLLGAGAIAIDVGALYAERAQLQNGADSAALAVAANCAMDDCSGVGGVASTYAGGNDYHDGAATPTSVSFSTRDGKDVVTVEVKTNDAAGGDAIRHPLAQFIGIDTTTVHASGSAEWSGISGGNTWPYSISQCEFDTSMVGSGVRYTIRYDTEPTKQSELDCIGPNNHVIEGGFGWLELVGGECKAYSSIEDGAAIKTGAAIPNACRSELDDLEGKVVILPIHVGELGHKTYSVAMYVGFKITGWKFPSSDNTDPLARAPRIPCKDKGKDCFYIQGEYVDWYTMNPEMEGGGPNGGASLVKLTITPEELSDLLG